MLPTQSNPKVSLERFNEKVHRQYDTCCRANSAWRDSSGSAIPDHPSDFVLHADFGEGKEWVAGHCKEHLAAYMGMHHGVANAIVLDIAEKFLRSQG